MGSLCPRLAGGQSEVMTASTDPGTGGSSPTDDLVVRLRAAGCVFAEEEAVLLVEAAAGESSVLARLVAAREAGDPLEQLVGWAEFCGRRVAVGPRVFVPRVRTELLAERALALITDGDVVVELCCGVAAVAAVLQAGGRVGELYAADVDPEAVGYARRNVVEPGVVLVGDLFDPLPGGLRGRIDLLVANAPYVPTEAIALMPVRLVIMSRWSLWTAVSTGSTSTGGSSPRRRDGYGPGDRC